LGLPSEVMAEARRIELEDCARSMLRGEKSVRTTSSRIGWETERERVGEAGSRRPSEVVMARLSAITGAEDVVYGVERECEYGVDCGGG
jgi:hypothetical protein